MQQLRKMYFMKSTKFHPIEKAHKREICLSSESRSSSTDHACAVVMVKRRIELCPKINSFFRICPNAKDVVSNRILWNKNCNDVLVIDLYQL